MLELTFITSSTEKLAHARHLSLGYPVIISKKKYYGIGYVEPRIDNREQLLIRSIEDARRRFIKNVPNGDNKLFFIEDTSVKIHCLSSEKEFPGVDIKYWMQENDFYSVDQLLKQHNNRNVTVRSDLVLVFNNELKKKTGLDYKIFTSSVDGAITAKEFKIKTQPLYPWLNDKTFNKWFIPNGCNKPISLLPISVANKFDFRGGAFHDMLTFLKQEGLLKDQPESTQLQLFKPAIFIICGPTCAGKTTLSEHLVKEFNYYHFEASDFMYLSYYERHGIKTKVSIVDFATEALKTNPAIVVDQVLKIINQLKDFPIVVTGFRSPLEVKHFLDHYNQDLAIKTIYVDANQVLRFERNLKRNRIDVVKTLDEFCVKDEKQYKMGLKGIEALHDLHLKNEGEIIEYFAAFETAYDRELKELKDKKGIHFRPAFIKRTKLQNIIIEVLSKQDQNFYFTTTEISKLIEEEYLIKKSKNNVSRYFNQNFYPYYEVILRDGIACYRLSQTGLSYSKMLKDN